MKNENMKKASAAAEARFQELKGIIEASSDATITGVNHFTHGSFQRFGKKMEALSDATVTGVNHFTHNSFKRFGKKMEALSDATVTGVNHFTNERAKKTEAHVTKEHDTTRKQIKSSEKKIIKASTGAVSLLGWLISLIVGVACAAVTYLLVTQSVKNQVGSFFAKVAYKSTADMVKVVYEPYWPHIWIFVILVGLFGLIASLWIAGMIEGGNKNEESK